MCVVGEQQGNSGRKEVFSYMSVRGLQSSTCRLEKPYRAFAGGWLNLSPNASPLPTYLPRARSLNRGANANGEGKKEGRWKNLRHAILGRSPR